MSHNQILSRAQELIQQGWTKKYLARDAKGYCVGPYSSNAACYCAIGAIARALYEQEPLSMDPIMCVDIFLGSATRSKLVLMNDTTESTKEQILAELEALKQ